VLQVSFDAYLKSGRRAMCITCTSCFIMRFECGTPNRFLETVGVEEKTLGTDTESSCRKLSTFWLEFLTRRLASLHGRRSIAFMGDTTSYPLSPACSNCALMLVHEGW